MTQMSVREIREVVRSAAQTGRTGAFRSLCLGAGVVGRRGGWVYLRGATKPIAQGWQGLAGKIMDSVGFPWSERLIVDLIKASVTPTEVDQAHAEALAENLDRWVAGGPLCSQACVDARGIAAGHLTSCPRNAYIIAGQFSDYTRVADLVEAAHAEALAESVDRAEVIPFARVWPDYYRNAETGVEIHRLGLGEIWIITAPVLGGRFSEVVAARERFSSAVAAGRAEVRGMRARVAVAYDEAVAQTARMA